VVLGISPQSISSPSSWCSTVVAGAWRTPARNGQMRDCGGIVPLNRIPSSDAFGDWLRNMGVNGGLCGLDKVNRRVLKRAMRYDGIKDYTLDIDATGIEAEKQSAKMPCKGFISLRLIKGLLAYGGPSRGKRFITRRWVSGG
jgi:hypothetical protein